jgi:hypothetical protein
VKIVQNSVAIELERVKGINFDDGFQMKDKVFLKEIRPKNSVPVLSEIVI